MNIWNHFISIFKPVPPAAETDRSAEGTPPSPPVRKHSRTEAENQLIAVFKSTHGDLLEKLEDAVYTFNRRTRQEEDPVLKAELCRKTIAAYSKLKTVCGNIGPGGALYFEDMWEHCSNSENSDFRFIAPVEALLKELEAQSTE